MSVVVPCFRCAPTIERALESVRCQTTAPSEVLLVDDASNDGTAELLERLAQYAGKDLHSRVIRLRSNAGPSAARNAGWEAAREKYVAFLDADATWHPQKVQLQHRFMEAHEDVAVAGHLRVVMPGALDVARFPEQLPVVDLRFHDLLWSNPIAPSTMMVRRQLQHRFPDALRRMEDQRFLLDLTRAGHKLALLRAPLAAHHKPDFGAGGLSADLVAMEKAELENYRTLWRERALGTPLLITLYAWSLAKFGRRLAIVTMRRALGTA